MKRFDIKSLVPLLFLITGIGLIIWFFASNGGPYSDYTGRTTGTVLSCVQTGWADTEGDTDSYDLEVRYSVEEKEYTVSGLDSNIHYSAGDEVEMAYLPDDPSRAVLKSSAENGFIMPLAGGVLCVIAVFMLVAGRKKAA